MNRAKWTDEDEILRNYEQDIKRADELGLTRLSGTLSASEYQAKVKAK